jgi:hypothetical protein
MVLTLETFLEPDKASTLLVKVNLRDGTGERGTAEESARQFLSVSLPRIRGPTRAFPGLLQAAEGVGKATGFHFSVLKSPGTGHSSPRHSTLVLPGWGPRTTIWCMGSHSRNGYGRVPRSACHLVRSSVHWLHGTTLRSCLWCALTGSRFRRLTHT